MMAKLMAVISDAFHGSAQTKPKVTEAFGIVRSKFIGLLMHSECALVWAAD
jgi:hypothetical protein